MKSLIVKALLLSMCVVLAHGRIRHRELERLIQSHTRDTTNSLSDSHVLWNVTGQFVTFPSAIFPSTRSALAIVYTDDDEENESLMSINLQTGNIDWSRQLTAENVTIEAKDCITVSRDYPELYYVTRYNHTAQGKKCVELAAWQLRATQPQWQQHSCYDNGTTSVKSTVLVYSVKGNEVVLRVDRVHSAEPRCILNVIGFDGMHGTELYRVENITCSADTAIDQHDADDNQLLVVRHEKHRTATVYKIDENAITLVNVVTWGREYASVIDAWELKGFRGSSVMLLCKEYNGNYCIFWRGVDVLTNETVWSSDTVNNSLVDQTWANNNYPNYTSFYVTLFWTNPANSTELVLLGIAFDDSTNLAILQAGLMGSRNGSLTAVSAVMGPFNLDNTDLDWFGTTAGDLVLSVRNLKVKEWRWTGLSSNMSVISEGMFTPYDKHTMASVLTVTATSATVVRTMGPVSNPTGMQAIKFDSANTTSTE